MLRVCDGLRDSDGEAVKVLDKLPHPEAEAHALCARERLGKAEALLVREGLRVCDGLCEGEVEAEGLREALPLEEGEALRLGECELLGQAEGLPEGEGGAVALADRLLQPTEDTL